MAAPWHGGCVCYVTSEKSAFNLNELSLAGRKCKLNISKRHQPKITLNNHSEYLSQALCSLTISISRAAHNIINSHVIWTLSDMVNHASVVIPAVFPGSLTAFYLPLTVYYYKIYLNSYKKRSCQLSPPFTISFLTETNVFNNLWESFSARYHKKKQTKRINPIRVNDAV